MPALLLVLEVAVVIVVVYMVYNGMTAWRRGGRPAEVRRGGWQPLHYAQDGQTVVAVARATPEGHVIERHVVARIPDSDRDWSRKFVEAKLEAEERAFHLNADDS